MNYLGISAFYHDSAAALVVDGKIIACAQEERFTRIKHDPRFPTEAIKYCLTAGNLRLADIDYIVFYEKPFLKFERLLETYLSYAPRGFKSFKMALPLWVKSKLFQKRQLVKSLDKIQKVPKIVNKLLFTEHHQSHAASAFYPSPFGEAVVLTMDGVGEWCTTSLSIGSGNKLDIKQELHFPHSLGLLYSAFTYYTGFKVNAGEYKVMGLAPYGEPKYKQTILDNLISLKSDGSFKLNQKYFNYATGLTMTNHAFNDLFGGPPRQPESPLTQKEMDLAASIQAVTEEVVLRIANYAYDTYNIPNLCLAGGVALNCVANGKLLKQSKFKNIWIQPAAGDAGGALGAALAAHYSRNNAPRLVNATDTMRGAYLGPEYTDTAIEQSLIATGAIYHKLSHNEMLDATATALSASKAIGWFQGRMEFGPRALGARSIIADPRSESMQKMLNLKVKFRESFRPFAPSVLREDVNSWFDINVDSPYMLLVSEVSENKRHKVPESAANLFGIDKLNIQRSDIPAVTHVDFSARIQTVHKETNPIYYELLKRFKQLTGCPVVVNTSFNVRGEPLVCSPSDAIRCFMGTELDMLVMGNFILYKQEQPAVLAQQYHHSFALD
jgi:carbamoyltransferase